MRIALCCLLTLLSMALASCGLRPEVYVPNKVAISVEMKLRRVLEHPEKIELLTLNPTPLGVEELVRADIETSKAFAAKRFHGYGVLGRAELDNGDTADLINALYRGIDESQGMVADCFNPRHGIRAEREGVVVELVICFECLSMQVFVDGVQRKSSILTHSSPRKTFNRVASANELQLAPKK